MHERHLPKEFLLGLYFGRFVSNLLFVHFDEVNSWLRVTRIQLWLKIRDMLLHNFNFHLWRCDDNLKFGLWRFLFVTNRLWNSYLGHLFTTVRFSLSPSRLFQTWNISLFSFTLLRVHRNLFLGILSWCHSIDHGLLLDRLLFEFGSMWTFTFMENIAH